MADLSRVRERDALSPRREPHWQRLCPKCYVGYRPSLREGRGSWIARAYDDDSRRYRTKMLVGVTKLAASDQFTAAKKEAESFGEAVAAGGVAELAIETVEQACRRYAEGRHDIGRRFERYVYGDPIAKIKLEKLRRHHLQGWRERMAATPSLVSRRKIGRPTTRPRAPSTVNRDMAMLRAALNKVLARGTPGTEAAWDEALRSIRNADRQRTLYLDKAQRRSLLNNIDEAAEPFVRSLCLLPLRPGAVASLLVSDFNARTSELTINRDKSGKPRRILIPGVVANLFTEQARSKSPADSLFTRPQGKPWSRHDWKGPIAEAAERAELPSGVTAYTLRHSTITDLVMSGLPLLTIAQISDTSVEMIERHYGHLCRETAAEALASLAL